jgi:hypothetical protein
MVIGAHEHAVRLAFNTSQQPRCHRRLGAPLLLDEFLRAAVTWR